VIADGLVPADWSFAEFDAGLDVVGHGWLAACATDADCRRHSGVNPIVRYREALAALDHGPCRDLGLTPELFKQMQANLLLSDEPLRRLVPVVAHRVRRCGEDDREAVRHLIATLFESGAIGEDPARHNPVAQRHLALSALWRVHDPSAEEIEGALRHALFDSGVSVSFARTFPTWPRASSRLTRRPPAYARPMLLLHGTLDPTMPLARLSELRRAYRRPAQTFVAVPRAGHVTLNTGDCIRGLYLAFLRDPRAPLDTRCVADAAPRGVTPDVDLALAVFGVPDVWGDRK
jgi:hypothetical protein